jgi:hypothetical protein
MARARAATTPSTMPTIPAAPSPPSPAETVAVFPIGNGSVPSGTGVLGTAVTIISEVEMSTISMPVPVTAVPRSEVEDTIPAIARATSAAVSPSCGM